MKKVSSVNGDIFHNWLIKPLLCLNLADCMMNIMVVNDLICFKNVRDVLNKCQKLRFYVFQMKFTPNHTVTKKEVF